MMKKLLIGTGMFVFKMFSFSPARQGCCSHHGVNLNKQGKTPTGFCTII